MSMITVEVKRETHTNLKQLKKEKEFKSIDETVNYLLDNVDNTNIDYSKTNINLNEDTLKRLKDFKSYPSESNNDVLYRLLSEL